MFRILRSLAVFVTVAAMLAAGTAATALWWVNKELASIPTFDDGSFNPLSVPGLGPAGPAAEEPFSVLVASTGSEGLDAAETARTGIGEGRARMADGLTDTLMLVMVNPARRSVAVLSIPRDTYVAARKSRINALYNRGGMPILLDAVEDLTGIRADHQVLLNFAAFVDLVDLVGGVDLVFESPVRDAKAMLDISATGCVHLDGATALAFARSRQWQVLDDGRWRSDATSSDWGRIERQQTILRAVAAKLLTPATVTRIPGLSDVVQDNARIDRGLTPRRIVSVAVAFRSGVADLAASTYPGRGTVIDGGSVIVPDRTAGLQVVAQLAARAGFPLPGQTPATPPSDLPVAPLPTPTAAPSASPTASVTQEPSPNRWSPDRGAGAGGLRYTTCSNGVPPKVSPTTVTGMETP